MLGWIIAGLLLLITFMLWGLVVAVYRVRDQLHGVGRGLVVALEETRKEIQSAPYRLGDHLRIIERAVEQAEREDRERKQRLGID